MTSFKKFDQKLKELKENFQKENMEFKKKKFSDRIFGVNSGKFKLQLLDSTSVELLCRYFYNEGIDEGAQYIYDVVKGDKNE